MLGVRCGAAVLIGAVLLMAEGCARSRSACADGSCRGRAEDAGPPAMQPDDAGPAPDDAAGQAGSAPSGMAGTDGARAGAGGSNAGGSNMAGADAGGVPWYHAIDVCRAPALTGGGRAVGECTGDCRFELEFVPGYFLGNRECFRMSVNLVVRDSSGAVRPILAALSEPAWERLASISRALEIASGAMTGECPDCSAGDEAWLLLARSRGPVRYPRDNPPAALREADAFVQEVIDQLAACSGDLIEQCGVESSACSFTYSHVERATERECFVPLDDASPCTTALRCLCGGDVLPDPEDTTIDACVERWLLPRGAPTLADLCVSSAPSATHTLVEAITAFGTMHGGSVTMNAGLCSMIPAFY